MKVSELQSSVDEKDFELGQFVEWKQQHIVAQEQLQAELDKVNCNSHFF